MKLTLATRKGLGKVDESHLASPLFPQGLLKSPGVSHFSRKAITWVKRAFSKGIL